MYVYAYSLVSKASEMLIEFTSNVLDLLSHSNNHLPLLLLARFCSIVMPRATAVIPEQFARQLNNTFTGDAHEFVEYMGV